MLKNKKHYNFQLRVTGGKGGDGAIMFMNLCKNEFAGPGGGDGGNGGHVIFEVIKKQIFFFFLEQK